MTVGDFFDKWNSMIIDFDLDEKNKNIDMEDYKLEYQVPYRPDAVEYEVRYFEIDHETKTVILRFEE